MTDGTKLLAQGRPLVLVDGSTVYLRYGMHALALLEDEFGSLVEMYREVVATAKKRMYSQLSKMIAAGLWHVVEGGRAMGVSDLVVALDARLDPKRMSDYEDVIILALADALPNVSPPAGTVPNGTSPREKAGSRGRATTGSARSGTAARRRSSGR